MDARSERWREHRKKVRSEIVDAAFRAIDHLGPELSLREIAEEAGTAKPKIYRHFADKSDLFQAIGQRLRDMLWAAIFPSINLSTDPAREVIRRSVEQYVRLVDEHPSILRFLIQGRFADQSESTMRALNEGREITLAMADMFDNELRDIELDAAALELAAYSAFGSIASATDWWLGQRQGPSAPDAARGVRRAPDHHHGRLHQRHLRTTGHQDRPGLAAAQGCQPARTRRLASNAARGRATATAARRRFNS